MTLQLLLFFLKPLQNDLLLVGGALLYTIAAGFHVGCFWRARSGAQTREF